MRDATAVPAGRKTAGRLAWSVQDKTAARQPIGILWGGIKCQGQSERPKPDPRRSIEGVESSGQPVRATMLSRMGPKRRLGSSQQDRGGIGANLGFPGASRPMPSAQALTNQQVEQR